MKLNPFQLTGNPKTKTKTIKKIMYSNDKNRKTPNVSQSSKMVFLTNESANKAEIDILSARDTTRPGP